MSVEAMNKEFRDWWEKIAKNICPRCSRKMEKKQSGNWIVATPCGHKLYQGQRRQSGPWSR